MVYAFASRKTAATLDAASTEVVGLAFEHSLARVKFTFTNGFSEAYTMKVTGLIIDNAISSGTFELPAATWTKDDATFKLAYDSSADVDQLTPAVCPYQYIIPGKQELTVSFKVVITNTANADDTKEFALNNVKLALPAVGETLANTYVKGHSYNFTATIDPSVVDPGQEELKPIQFSAEVTPWDADEEGTVTVQ